MKNIFKSKFFIFLMAMIIVTIITIGVVGKVTNNNYLGKMLNIPLKPAQQLFENIGSMFNNEKSKDEEVRELQDRIEKLQEELLQYSSYQDKVDELGMENTDLRKLLKLKEKNPEFNYEPASIIAKDPSNWFLSFTVDKGAADGISVDDPVMSSRGLMGRVVEVGKNYSKIMSIIDMNSHVSVINRSTGELLRISGDLKLQKQGKCKVEFVEGDNLKIGDIIETSGMGGTFPKGLEIGVVSDKRGDPSTYGLYGVVDPYVNFKRMNDVMIIKNVEKVNADD